MSASHPGGCLCGAIRFIASGAGKHATHCHCSLCRRAAGAPVVTWVSFPRDQVVFSGRDRKVFQSSEHAVRGFCDTCGASLTFEDAREPEWLDLAVAAFDDPEAFPPLDHIWTESALSFMRFDDGLPQYPKRRADGA